MALYPASGPQTTHITVTSASTTEEHYSTPAPSSDNRTGPAASPAHWSQAYFYAAYPPSGPSQTTQMPATIASGTQEQDTVFASSVGNQADTDPSKEDFDEEMYDLSPR